ncbi:MAG: hypothetical protein G8345_06395 [Magnetococcales bacterium]|nr:hypothetical protein [Magnetococcales bacterium]NGZ26500.1 hypothetical protein [Magnetococcales bacterium]
MNRVESISVSFTEAVQHSPGAWILVAFLLFLAFMIAGYYIQEKFILKRRFQSHVQLKTPSERRHRPEPHENENTATTTDQGNKTSHPPAHNKK